MHVNSCTRCLIHVFSALFMSEECHDGAPSFDDTITSAPLSSCTLHRTVSSAAPFVCLMAARIGTPLSHSSNDEILFRLRVGAHHVLALSSVAIMHEHTANLDSPARLLRLAAKRYEHP